MRKWFMRWFFWLSYIRGRTPWDTNVTPPELERTITGPGSLAPGRALDLGCGTGTNVIYLAQHGWESVGVDFVEKPIRQAQKKAQAAAVEARFFKGDVTRLNEIKGLEGSFDLVLDIGCLHSLSIAGRDRYVAGLCKRLRPGGTFLLYAFGPNPRREPGGGLNATAVESLLGPGFRLGRVEHGTERKRRPSAWYWFTYGCEK